MFAVTRTRRLITFPSQYHGSLGSRKGRRQFILLTIRRAAARRKRPGQSSVRYVIIYVTGPFFLRFRSFGSGTPPLHLNTRCVSCHCWHTKHFMSHLDEYRTVAEKVTHGRYKWMELQTINSGHIKLNNTKCKCYRVYYLRSKPMIWSSLKGEIVPKIWYVYKISILQYLLCGQEIRGRLTFCWIPY